MVIGICRFLLIGNILEIYKKTLEITWKRLEIYKKGLEIDTFAESLYQRLMICYQQTGCTAEAIAVYQRCRTNLSNGLCIAPSRETELIRASLR